MKINFSILILGNLISEIFLQSIISSNYQIIDGYNINNQFISKNFYLTINNTYMTCILLCSRLVNCKLVLFKNHNICILLTLKPTNLNVYQDQNSAIYIKPYYRGDNIKSRIAHSGMISCMLVIDNERFASGSFDKSVKIWKYYQTDPIFILTGHTNYIRSLALLSNGRLASGSVDRTIKIWNLTTGGLIRTLSGHIDEIPTLKFLSNGYLASGSGDQTIKIWETDTIGYAQNTIYPNSNWVLSLNQLPNGNLISGFSNGNILVIALDGTILNTLTGHSSQVWSIIILPGNLIASVEYNYKIIIRNGTDYSQIKQLNYPTARFIGITQINNNLLASLTDTDTIQIWLIDSGQIEFNMVCAQTNLAGQNAFIRLNDGNIACGSLDYAINILKGQ